MSAGARSAPSSLLASSCGTSPWLALSCSSRSPTTGGNGSHSKPALLCLTSRSGHRARADGPTTTKIESTRDDGVSSRVRASIATARRIAGGASFFRVLRGLILVEQRQGDPPVRPTIASNGDEASAISQQPPTVAGERVPYHGQAALTRDKEQCHPVVVSDANFLDGPPAALAYLLRHSAGGVVAFASIPAKKFDRLEIVVAAQAIKHEEASLYQLHLRPFVHHTVDCCALATPAPDVQFTVLSCDCSGAKCLLRSRLEGLRYDAQEMRKRRGVRLLFHASRARRRDRAHRRRCTGRGRNSR